MNSYLARFTFIYLFLIKQSYLSIYFWDLGPFPEEMHRQFSTWLFHFSQKCSNSKALCQQTDKNAKLISALCA